MTPIAQIDPSALEVFDAEAMIRYLANLYGVSPKILRTAHQLEMRRQQQQMAMRQQQGAEQAQAMASAGKDGTAALANLEKAPRTAAAMASLLTAARRNAA